MQITPAQFDIHPSSGVPIYRQLMDQVAALVVGGQVQAGDMLPSVREMGTALGVNMMTVSKAYARLEAEGVVERIRGRGMAIATTESTGTVAERSRELRPHMEQAVVRGRQLGLTDEQIRRVLDGVLKD
ncbi:MAG: GntR family transcriptional regulator [Planctomycetaceae bacterium]|nr:GntR family transcriptional regulator [Planctomycetaceae bacterium]